MIISSVSSSLTVIRDEWSFQVLDREVSLNIKQEDVFLSLAKSVGLSIKQIAPYVSKSNAWLDQKWSTFPAPESGRKPSVSKKHREIIIVLLLAHVDLFSLSAIFGYAPKVILRFVENQCKEGLIVCHRCNICGLNFLDFENKMRCQSTNCKKEHRRQYKNKHKKYGRLN